MKITDVEVIKNGEQDLIDGITADLDWTVLEKIFEGRHQLGLGEDVTYKKGDIVVHDNQIAYLLEFDITVPISIILDRSGNCLKIQSTHSRDSAQGGEAVEETEESEPEKQEDPPLAEILSGEAGFSEPGAESGDDRIASLVEDARQAFEEREEG